MPAEVVIGQRFRLGRVVRESGVAIVYEARHRNGAEAWIKLPRSREHAAALLDEARVANALGTRAVNVRDDGSTEDGLPYLVLEPVTGQRLDHWRASSGGRAPPDEAMGLGDELCQAIGTLHGAGFAVGLLRTDAIVVLPRGGMCLLELEHAKAATPATIKEDVERVGRVLYEMLSGTPCVAQSAPLHDLAPELPRAMTSTVDDAARGRFATIEELRVALRASMPEWLGPPRRPMPSVSPEDVVSESSAELDAIVFPRASRILFDPRDLVDSSRNVAAVSAESASEDPRVAGTQDASGASPGASAGGWPRVPSRPSASEVDAPPVAAFQRNDSQRPPKRGLVGVIVAGAAALAVLVGGIVLAVLFVGKDAAPPSAPEPKAAFAGMVASAEPPSEAVLPPPSAAPRASVAAGAIELDDLDVTAGGTSAGGASAGGASAASAVVAAPAPATGETSFRFEGHLSPRLVILDGIVVGVTTKELRVPCGAHSVKIGGKGAARTLDLPCGGEQGIVIASNGSWHAE
ncbi:MAG: hypothetical protein KF795_03665 [Labilithrix sp.]|nr:hypothetical protein [Labilithrix sp.]